MSLHISFSTSICPGWPLRSMLQSASDLGYDGIELNATVASVPPWEWPEVSGSRVVETRRILRDSGLVVSCVGTRLALDVLDEATRRAAIAEAERAIDVAAALGAGAIEVSGGATADHPASGIRLVQALSQLMERAAGAGTDVLLTTSGAVARPVDAASLLSSVSNARLGLVWDPATAFAEQGCAVEDGAQFGQSIRHVRVRGQFPVWQLPALASVHAPDGWVLLDPPSVPTPETAHTVLLWLLRWVTDLVRHREPLQRPVNGWVATVGRMRVEIHPDRQGMGRAAARAVADHLRAELARSNRVSLILASAPSQNEFLEALRDAAGIDWPRVTAFHLDEYVGVSPDHPASFRRFLLDRFVGHVPLGAFHGLDGLAADPGAECARYASLLREHPPTLAVLGIGENGHLAFIDPPVCDFFDPAAVRVVELDETCRTQQVHDGCFPRLDEVPRSALSLTIPYLLRVPRAVTIVPDPRKQVAVKAAVLGSVTPTCPASILRRHADATLYLDRASAAPLLQPEWQPVSSQVIHV